MLVAALAVCAAICVAGCGSGSISSTETTSTSGSARAHSACPFPASSDGGVLDVVLASHSQVVAAITVQSQATKWTLAVECRIQGESTAKGGQIVETNGSRWEFQPEDSRYRLIGGQCCIFASIPLADGEAAQALLGTVSSGDRENWTSLIAAGAALDQSNGVAHLLPADPAAGLGAWSSGFDYLIVTNESRPDCGAVSLYVTKSGPTGHCSDPPADPSVPDTSNVKITTTTVDNDRWANFVMSSLG